jgi:sec-independent protein translocase protein TatB
MFDFAWSEMALIAAVALVVLGPKELPHLLRAAGKWIAKARELARDFQAQVDDMVREAELDDVKKQVEQVGQQIEEVARTDVAAEIEKAVDPKGEVAEQLQLPDLSQIDTATPSIPATETTAVPEPVPAVNFPVIPETPTLIQAQPTQAQPTQAEPSQPDAEPAPPAKTGTA